MRVGQRRLLVLLLRMATETLAEPAEDHRVPGPGGLAGPPDPLAEVAVSLAIEATTWSASARASARKIGAPSRSYQARARASARLLAARAARSLSESRHFDDLQVAHDKVGDVRIARKVQAVRNSGLQGDRVTGP
jgi:hypothetical protein